MRVRAHQPPGLTSKPVRSCWPHSPHQQEIIPRDGTVAIQVYLGALSTAAGRGTEHMQGWVLTIVGRLARTSPVSLSSLSSSQHVPFSPQLASLLLQCCVCKSKTYLIRDPQLRANVVFYTRVSTHGPFISDDTISFFFMTE